MKPPNQPHKQAVPEEGIGVLPFTAVDKPTQAFRNLFGAGCHNIVFVALAGAFPDFPNKLMLSLTGQIPWAAHMPIQAILSNPMFL
ncbi:hypothetical protein NDK47_11755 [Brevibacillus ruminantium]|uniref:Uncharacterized protein n=1 Tax=Brevibacillus ruminantium TaxID=2950604 RepID=A0ABY4WN22_9BACL|nr:hypothetical protein [Brevibacillus ruminantium]USG68547.1 hypothetical protein NDK47_11755 [Brevibacillus ruminantium]